MSLEQPHKHITTLLATARSGRMASLSWSIHPTVYVLFAMAYTGVSAYLSPVQYTFNINLKTWNEARSICNDDKARLAVINSPVRDAVMFELVTHLGNDILTTDLWIGMFDTSPPDAEYVWSDCHPLGSWTDWAPGEPDRQTVEFCVRYTRRGYWRTRSCNLVYHFICERPLESCWFDTRTNSKLVGNGTIFTNVTLASCRNLCREDGNCTALTSFQDGSCFLQTSDVPHVLTSPTIENHDSAITEIKRCVAYVVSDFDNNVIDRSRIANNTCVPASTYLPTSHRGSAQSISSCSRVEENAGQTSGVDVNELRLDKQTLSSYKRRFYSVYDNRTSLVAIGSSGVGIICLVFAIIICLDLERLARGIYTTWYGSPRKVKVIHAKRRIP